MPVPDRLLPRRGLVDRLQRQRDLDELLAWSSCRFRVFGFEIRRFRKTRHTLDLLPQALLSPREERLVVVAPEAASPSPVGRQCEASTASNGKPGVLRISAR